MDWNFYARKSSLPRGGRPLNTADHGAFTALFCPGIQEDDCSGLLLARHDGINHTGQRCANDGCEPEEPELLNGPAANEERGTRAACRVHRKVGDRNADQVNQGQPEADRDGRESLWCTLVGGTQDDHQKEEG